jgi:hypothetical protein
MLSLNNKQWLVYASAKKNVKFFKILKYW